MDIQVARVYAHRPHDAHTAILVDRLWPRGMAKADLVGVPWLKDIAPSDDLRHWFGHEPPKWAEFRRRYFHELDANPEPVAELRKRARHGPITLLFAAHDEAHNNAVALREYLLR